ncbi:E3 ubiquitin-protein ligase PRT6-like [Papaver somniferum]|uniref:E3 ubiquitin-protein ligase PRT6-like n=1 Tax=Papaver somniferum TaxID=3469 RepID=UPI000E6FE274|nr:E3 ubiquitin-protein ligase PRT6-like [Papaver somniferum]XP_026444612.1 E3 ubiquitin-protein ligase PRT6-like [Papaver somniferum]XP_026444613.1 E3 ubiquitin-protein ligase PRT6-like [Papaver somniferum]
MEIDSSYPSTGLAGLSPRDRILLKLSRIGVPEDIIEQGEQGLVAYLKENKSKLNDVVLYGVLPSDEEVIETIAVSKIENGEGDVVMKKGPKLKELFKECILWLRWLMFEDEPGKCLENLGKLSVGQRGVCGAVWGLNDIAYRCKTCENDPTCAICVTCFQNGNHKDHDYSLMYTGGGCCDCGDETAWKQNGFCSKHKGAEQIQPLPEEIACTVGPVLDVLLGYWEEKLLTAQAAYLSKTLKGGEHVKVEHSLTSTVVEMLLEFCKHSESLLSFISRRIFSSVPLLDVLVRAERFLNKGVTTKLHELLLKLLGDPVFKYEFAKVFIMYYPDTIKESIKEGSDSVLEKYKLVATFSVQIFTVPTLTPRLVREMNLLGILFGCLEDMFSSCAGQEGHIQVSKWASSYETTVRLVEDTRFVLNHTDVAKYVTHEQPDISKTWMRLLAFVQGMNPQKRVTGLHVEEENESMHIPFVLGHSIANIHSLLVNGAFSVNEMNGNTSNLQDMDEDDGDSLLRHAKVGRLSQQSSVCSTSGRSATMDATSQGGEECFNNGNGVSVPSTVTWLTCECLQAIENWLGFNALQMESHSSLSQDISRGAVANFLSLKKTFSRIAKPKSISKVSRSSSARGRFGTSSENLGRHNFLSSSGYISDKRGYSLVGTKETDISARSSSSGLSNEDTMEAECSGSDSLGLLSSSDWPNIAYDVSSQDISVHIPLHRLLSLLLLKALKKSYGETGGSEFSSPNSARLLSSGHDQDFFGQMLLGWHPVGFSAFVMEHPLRIKVFCAQVRAGMWRKNGDVAMFSCEWYRSVRWSEQGLELDIFLLQCCAALAPPDLFVKRILERFGLSSYLSLNPQQSNEHEAVLVQEMLTLIIQIVKERRFCGLSTAESLRRELVYKLAIGDATRSQLVKSLPQDLSKNGQLQTILDSVADYSNPSGMKQGKYSLRKSCWEELDLYHPRWNSRDLQVAEERYMRFCKVSALAGQLPRWTKVFYPLNGISRIATSRALLEIIRAVLYYALLKDKQSHARAPDVVVLIALHLLSLGLDICYVQRQSSGQEEVPLPLLALASEEISGGPSVGSDAVKQKTLLSLLVSTMRMYKNITFEAGQCDLSALIANILKKFADLSVCCAIELQILAPEVVPHMMLDPSPNSDFSSSSSDAEERKLKARARQAAIMEKMKAAQSKFMESLTPEENVEAEVCSHFSEESTPIVCCLCRDPDSRSPLSFLVYLQKSRLASFVERVPPMWGKTDKNCLSATIGEIAELRKHQQSGLGATLASNIEQLVQNAISEFSHDGLPIEVEGMVGFIKAQLDCTTNVQRPSTSYGASMDTLPSSIEMMEVDIYQSVVKELQNATDANQKFLTEHDKEDLTENRHAQCTLLGKYMASLSRQKSEKSLASKNSRSDNALSKISGGLPAYDGFGPTDSDGIHISSCGHAVHHECRSRYLSSLRERYIRRMIFEGGSVVDPDQGEFLCPLCRRLANSVLPAVSNNFSNLRKEISSTSSGAGPIIGSLNSSGTNAFRLSLSLTLLQSTSKTIGESRMHVSSLDPNRKMQPTLDPILNILCRMYYPDKDKHEKFLASGRVSHSMVLWDTLKYSLISTEIAARGVRSDMCSGSRTSTSGLEVLYGELESSSGFILSLLLQVVLNTRNENLLQVLLRYRAINLFAASICSGVSLDNEISPAAVSGIGDISSVLKHVDKGAVYPDTQFWGRAADPVLSRDPFSSLMWILFSLPSPFLSSEDCFLSLVHLFYAVSVIQVLVTCIGKHQTVTAELGLSDCLISDLCKNVEGTSAKYYFVSNYMDEASCQPKDIVRRMSYPYLRRCALLWKLLKSSTPEPFSDRSHERNWVSSNLNDSALVSSLNDLPIELKEVEELEQMFQIPDLDVVFKDKILRTLGLKWFNHFSREFGSRNYGRVFHSTPAVPFRLMRLPLIYQDLLEKYIKQKCPECEAAQDDPALCLLCGRICSPSWKPCCRESGCQSHAMACGAGIGVYLLIRRTTILLQRSARQAPWPSPYLDAFGEEDIEMRRGKPLFLNEERYATLTNMVASHGLDRSSDVLRQTTIDGLFMM